MFSSKKKDAIGIFADGLDLKMVYLSSKKGKITIRSLVEDTLKARLDVEEEVSSEEPLETGDAFGVEAPETKEAFAEEPLEEEEGEETNQDIFVRLMSAFPLEKCTLAFTLFESKVGYYDFEGDFGPKKKEKNLQKELVGKIRDRHQIEVPPDGIAYIRRGEESLLAIARYSSIHIIDVLDTIKPFLEKTPSISLIDTNEVALMNLARASYVFPEDEVTAIVYLGDEFSRVLFMQGGAYLSFGAIIHNEDLSGPQLLDAVFSKIILEQDVSGVPEINRFLLAGGCARFDAQAFFSSQFPDTQVEYMVPGFLDRETMEEKPEDLSAFAIPIALAWKTLDIKNPLFYPTNLLPKTIRERQKVYKVAWHGLILITLVCSSTLFLLWQWKEQTDQIEKTQNALVRTETLIEASEAGLEKLGNLDSLRSQVAVYGKNISFIDTLSEGSKRWSPTLEGLAKKTRSVNALWFESLIPAKNDRVSLSGWTLYRSRIPRISESLDATVSKVSSDQIRGHTVYRFYINIKSPEE
jgi:hypothetical protein